MRKLFTKKFDVVSIGGAVRDMTFYTDKGRMFRVSDDMTAQRMLGFEYGAKIHIHDATATLGGGAANTAYAFSQLGLKAGLIACVGMDPEGAGMLEELKKKNIHTNFCQTTKFAKSGFSVIISTSRKDHDHVTFTHRGANDYLMVDDKKIGTLQTKWIYVSSLAGEHWQKVLKNIVHAAEHRNIKIAWNPGAMQLQAGKKNLEKILARTDVLLVNKDEAIELVLSGMRLGRRNPKFLSKTTYLLNILREWGPKIVVITDGDKGASALRNEKIHRVNAVKKPVVDTNGVGDTFGASFVAGLIKTHDLDTALRWGVTNAAANLSRIGAQDGILDYAALMRGLPRKYRG